ncbi:hypothetical protein Aab01nite_54760 [Paractinoplanes abujensis]|uniref:Uncharacterized protein (TIGR02271 family) n=1 Tax=Paractinoplanes abujensis TaxID=882441 RepID=A0A7W7CSD2_9ACTN|nr:PRC and DUF2382 domain-containing protein [Actinoplanes abujensis]MBB4693454.1 uncharacterized protein (TIGR02271 family) [Actinoplanes abujensis]GID21886.1 hypothetical protein Aab01nite_54760 [Actinoplanes abujensis]
MITQNDLARLNDADVYGPDGDKIGSVGQIYLDTDSGDPEWVAVRTGLFGTKETFIPLQRATLSDDRITVAYDKATVKDAPRIEPDGALSYTEENELYTYYGVQSTGAESGSSSYDTGTAERTGYARQDDTGHRSQSSAGDDAMTRSEERLVTDTRTEDAGKARLRKYVVTEQQQVRVPVAHEEVRLEREPITEANRGDAYAGAEITEAEHEVTLRAERPVVDTETVPVERVRLGKETVRDEETVSGEVRKEQIEFDGPDSRR